MTYNLAYDDKDSDPYKEVPINGVLKRQDLWRNVVHIFENSDSCAQDTGRYLGGESYQGKLNPSWIGEFYNRLSNMRQIEYNWDGYESEPPNSVAIRNTRDVLNILNEIQLKPTSMAPSAEEGVTISFSYKDKYAIVESYNDGDMLTAYCDERGERKIWEFKARNDEIRENLKLIETYLNA